jgi:hypothetical protein
MGRSVRPASRLTGRIRVWPRLAALGALLGGAVVLVRALPAQDPTTPAPQLESEEVARYRQEAEGSDRPIDHYNLGTALLRDGRPAEALEPLGLSLRSERPLVRQNGFYNLGLGSAIEGHLGDADAQARRAQLIGARDAFRQVLREREDDEDARWNLELVERWLEEDEQSGDDGDEGGEAQAPGGAGAGGAPSGGAGQERMISPEEAAALLDSAGRAEASIRDRVMGRNRFRDPVVEKNW